jgi:hypothetical protein
VAAVFNNDGTGQRGDLAAVVRAILLDAEARAVPANDTGGKLKEPLLRLTQLWRAYDAKAQNGRYDVTNVEGTLGEAPLKSASVFNFFSPSYAPTGEVANRNLVAPEAELATEYLESTTTSYFFDQIYNRNSASTLGPTAIVIDITDELAAADNPDALVALIANKLLGKPMSAALGTEVRATINRFPVTSRKLRATEALFLVATAPNSQRCAEDEAMTLTRRRFLEAAAASGLIYTFGGRLGGSYAQAATFSDYKALVCVFLLGGNDSWSMVVPTSTAEYNAYAASRQNLAIAADALLPISPSNPLPATYGLHPSLASLKPLFDSGKCAFIANVGPLIVPTTPVRRGRRAAAAAALLAQRPANQWQSLRGRAQLKTGWADHVADAFASQLGTQRLVNVSLVASFGRAGRP